MLIVKKAAPNFFWRDDCTVRKTEAIAFAVRRHKPRDCPAAQVSHGDGLEVLASADRILGGHGRASVGVRRVRAVGA
ncbi:hypothetical protein JCM15831A_10950 [Asaia astilbis]